MALTVTFDAQPTGRTSAFPNKLRRGTITFDSSYATGGEAVTGSLLELPARVDSLHVQPAAGFTFEWDKTNSKLKVFSTIRVYTATFDAASLGAVTSRDDSITFTGVVSTDIVLAVIPPPAAAASVVVQACRVTGTDTVVARLTNASAGAVDLASGTWSAVVVSANGAAKEIASTTDLSAVVTRFRAEGR